MIKDRRWIFGNAGSWGLKPLIQGPMDYFPPLRHLTSFSPSPAPSTFLPLPIQRGWQWLDLFDRRRLLPLVKFPLNLLLEVITNLDCYRKRKQGGERREKETWMRYWDGTSFPFSSLGPPHPHPPSYHSPTKDHSPLPQAQIDRSLYPIWTLSSSPHGPGFNNPIGTYFCSKRLEESSHCSSPTSLRTSGSTFPTGSPAYASATSSTPYPPAFLHAPLTFPSELS